jgi:cysteine-rich repeat protein
MKTSIAIATFLVVGAGAAGAGAFAIPHGNYQGSDTLFNVTQKSLTAVGLTTTDYIGGGSGNAQAAMAANPPTQQAGPMSRMINSGGSACKFSTTSPGTGVSGNGDTNASTIVIGLDAVDVLASTSTGASSACTGGAAGPGTNTGLVFSGGPLAGSGQNWKDVLALVYGGKDIQTGVVDCNQAARISLVANWSQIFQSSTCVNKQGVCGDADHASATSGTGIVAGQTPLWHAFRRDDASGTSDVFSSILGLTPSTSTSAVNGFGTSPYCNALNWDTTTNAAGTCTVSNVFNPHNQFTGPGGVVDPLSDGKHRMPPPGLNGAAVWGSAPPTFKYKSVNIAFDVLPTSLQDNDPIRRACFGGTAGNAAKVDSEEVCNIDGSLGLVIPMPDSDFMLKVPDASHSGSFLVQYPSKKCDGSFVSGNAPNVFHCAPANVTHAGECPNGDSPGGTGCQLPIDKKDGFGQCDAQISTVAAFATRNVSNADGRAFNLWMTNGSVVDGAVSYAQFPLPAISSSADFAGGFSRIHAYEPVVAGLSSCQLVNMTDQIGCLVQSDPCSIGYAGDGGKTWNVRAGVASSNTDSIDVSQIYPQVSTVQLLGKTGEYPISRKLYFASLTGWSNVTSDELTLAKYEAGTLSESTSFDSILTGEGFFMLGPSSPAGPDAQFCEDFNEQVVCNPTTTSPSTLPANVNGCATNPQGIPTVSTICGDGKVDAYEECDHGTSNGTTGDTCSQTCRCTGAFPCP